ncbi:MAG TPA: hypothetical protein VIN09_02085 [Chloroflexota bacterium]
MDDWLILGAVLVAFLLLDVLAYFFGYDSREGVARDEPRHWQV